MVASSGVLLAGSEMGLYLQRILINDLQEVMSSTLIKCAHVAKWEIGGENSRGRHIISRYLVFSFCDLACERWLDFAVSPLPAPCCLLAVLGSNQIFTWCNRGYIFRAGS